MALQPITLAYKRSTKNFDVYEAPESVIPSQYIKKHAFGTTRPPEAITLTVEIAAHAGQAEEVLE